MCLLYFFSFLLTHAAFLFFVPHIQSNMLREKVSLGEECLEEEFLTELSLREEIARRKQHGEVLLARIQTLQVRAVGCALWFSKWC